MEPLLHSETRAGVAFLTLARPQKRNALTREFLSQLETALRELADRRELRALVLRAEGAAFCAGMDLGEMQARAQSPGASREYDEDARRYAEVILRLYDLSCPTVAVVQGPALAGGVGLVLACDVVLCGESASFCLPEPVRGIVAAMVSPLLQYRAGSGVATYLLLSGVTLSAELAKSWGICHDVVPTAELSERVEQVLGSILKGAPSALALTKSFLRECGTRSMRDLLERSRQVSAQARESDAAREGLAAFLEKRQPAWQKVAVDR
jgi:methylglutaconyl-CoA hydratase